MDRMKSMEKIDVTILTGIGREVHDIANSFCTECEGEIGELNIADFENVSRLSTESDHLDNIPPSNVKIRIGSIMPHLINRATKSFSQISLRREHCRKIFDNRRCLSNDDLGHPYYSDHNRKVELGNEILMKLPNNDETFHIEDQLTQNGRNLCDTGVQTEIQMNRNYDSWNTKFSSGTVLRKTEGSIERIDSTKIPNGLEDHSNVRNAGIVWERNEDNLKPIYESMIAALLKQQKCFVMLADDIRLLSSHLDEIRKTLASKASSTILLQPAATGYDCQFDFPHKTRFEKLPILIRSAKAMKKPFTEVAGTNNIESSSQTGFGLVRASGKRMNNARNISATKRFMSRIMSKDNIDAYKENRKNEGGKK